MLAACCRLNFTLSHLDVTCEAYDHFRACLHQLEQLREGPLRFAVEPVPASFPQRLAYERIRQLVGAATALGTCPGVTLTPRKVLSLVKPVVGPHGHHVRGRACQANGTSIAHSSPLGSSDSGGRTEHGRFWKQEVSGGTWWVEGLDAGTSVPMVSSLRNVLARTRQAYVMTADPPDPAQWGPIVSGS